MWKLHWSQWSWTESVITDLCFVDPLVVLSYFGTSVWWKPIDSFIQSCGLPDTCNKITEEQKCLGHWSKYCNDSSLILSWIKSISEKESRYIYFSHWIPYQMAYGQWNGWRRPVELKTSRKVTDTAEWKSRGLGAQGPDCDTGDVWLKWGWRRWLVFFCFFLTVSLAISRYLSVKYSVLSKRNKRR